MPEAKLFPLCRVWAEAEIIKDREIVRMSSEAILLHAVAVEVLGGQKARGTLDKTIKGLK